MRPTPKRLVINADDLGYDPEIDRGIFEAHARGVVTSATGMVDTPFAPAALRAAPASLALGLHAHGVRTTEHFLGDADLRPCWTPERLAPALETLEDGITELMCHPGYAPSHARTSFGAEREVELRSLCDARVRQALARAGAVLVSFRDL